ncbi:hypothetical protein [Bacillus haynesii]|uniref:hypothetical protein n=1 Tax=Bacillus haynesii TaxID=1925021 RepID=UPI0022807862|nr:hypothetical protein [Bacillus haynesii]MCY9217190.1 hypothetical protein [Bacillus haynesii]
MAKKNSLKLSDEDYNLISRKSYSNGKYKIGEYVEITNGQKMYVADCRKTLNGLNALTFVTEKDFTISNNGKEKDKIKHAVIVYRGSEPISGGQLQSSIDVMSEAHEKMKDSQKKNGLIPEGVSDTIDAGINNVAGVAYFANEIIQDWLMTDINYSVYKKPFEDGNNNQMVQADKYAKDIHKDMPNAKIHVTGHSLGGVNASYALVKNKFVESGVTFENPNIYDNLPEDVKAEALKGKFKSRLTEYISLNDGLSMLNRDSEEVGNVKVMYDESLPNGIEESLSDGQKFLLNTLKKTFKFDENPSVDMNLFLEAIMGSHDLSRYSFHADGTRKHWTSIYLKTLV